MPQNNSSKHNTHTTSASNTELLPHRISSH
jgi:hypothetical protein